MTNFADNLARTFRLNYPKIPDSSFSLMLQYDLQIKSHSSQIKFLQILRHFLLHFGKFLFDIFDIVLHFFNIDKRFFLKSIDIARNIQVKIILFDLVKGRAITVLFFRFILAVM